jgi:hypothetical protein
MTGMALDKRSRLAEYRWQYGKLVPRAVIRDYARQIAEQFHPEKIILFGSYAYVSSGLEWIHFRAFARACLGGETRRKSSYGFLSSVPGVTSPKRWERGAADRRVIW